MSQTKPPGGVPARATMNRVPLIETGAQAPQRRVVDREAGEQKRMELHGKEAPPQTVTFRNHHTATLAFKMAEAVGAQCVRSL